MPHQCLKCGTLFAEGTTTILRGCPECRGTRFFYTHEAIPSGERERLLQKAERDLPALVQEVLKERGIETVKAPRDQPLQSFPSRPIPPSGPEPPKPEGVLLPGNRLLVKLPKQVKQRLKRAVVHWDYEVVPSQAQVPPAFHAPAPSPVHRALGQPPVDSPAAPGPPAEATTRIPSPRVGLESARPETVNISQPGRYEIDVQRLLQNSPIVIQRDGTYLLHLPSIFESVRRPPQD